MKDYNDLRERWLAKYRQARRDPKDYKRVVYANSAAQPAYAAAQPVYAAAQPVYAATQLYAIPKHEYVDPAQEALKYLAQVGYRGLTVEDLTRLLPRDCRFEDELTVMADVRAYFTFAYQVGGYPNETGVTK